MNIEVEIYHDIKNDMSDSAILASKTYDTLELFTEINNAINTCLIENSKNFFDRLKNDNYINSKNKNFFVFFDNKNVIYREKDIDISKKNKILTITVTIRQYKIYINYIKIDNIINQHSRKFDKTSRLINCSSNCIYSFQSKLYKNIVYLTNYIFAKLRDIDRFSQNRKSFCYSDRYDYEIRKNKNLDKEKLYSKKIVFKQNEDTIFYRFN